MLRRRFVTHYHGKFILPSFQFPTVKKYAVDVKSEFEIPRRTAIECTKKISLTSLIYKDHTLDDFDCFAIAQLASRRTTVLSDHYCNKVAITTARSAECEYTPFQLAHILRFERYLGHDTRHVRLIG
jgi:hypothetical protein